MPRSRFVTEVVLILLASVALLWTGGVANAVSTKSAPQSAPKHCDKPKPDFSPDGPVTHKKAPAGTPTVTTGYSFVLTADAPKKARVGDTISVTATFVNNGKPGNYGFSTFAAIPCGGGGAGDGFTAFVNTGDSVSQVFTFDTDFFPAGTVEVTQTVYDMSTFSAVASKQTASIKLAG